MRFGQVVPLPIRAFAVIVIVRRAFPKQTMEMTEYGKRGKPRIRLSTLPTLFGNRFGITTFPRPRLLAFFKVQEQERPNVRPLDFKGVVRMARHCHPWHGAAKDITVSQTMLRHAKPDTTAIYTHGNFGMRWMLSACT